VALKLLEMFVDIGAKTQGAEKGIDSVGKSAEGLRSRFTALRVASAAIFGAITAAVGYATKAALDFSAAQNGLRSALAATGQEVDGNVANLTAFAEQLSKVTTLGVEETLQLAKTATNLGVTADQLQNVIRAGSGLGKRFFGGDAEAGVTALSKAIATGNFRELDRIVPGLRNVKDAQEKLNIIAQAAQVGYKEQLDAASGYKGQLAQLHNTIKEVAASLGAALLPTMKAFVENAKAIVEVIKQQVDKNKDAIIHWLKVAAAISAIIAIGPSVVKTISVIANTIVAAAKLAFSAVATTLSALFSPLGAIILAIAGVATAFAYFAGSGNSAINKVIDGFKSLWDMVKLVFQNTSTLGEAWSAVMSELGFYVARVWIEAKSTIIDAWISVKGFFANLWADIVEGVHIAAANIKDAWSSVVTYMTKVWYKMLYDTEAADREAEMRRIDRLLATGKITKEQADKQRAAVLNAQTGNDLIDKQRAGDKGEVEKAKADAKDKAKAARQAADDEEAKARAANNRNRRGDLQSNAEEQKKFEAELAKKHKESGQQSLAEQVEGLFGKIRAGTGIDDLLKQIEDIKKEAEKVKANAKTEANDPNKFNAHPGALAAQKPTQLGDISSTFKDVTVGNHNRMEAYEEEKKRDRVKGLELQKQAKEELKAARKAQEATLAVLRQFGYA
jgi:hypothetical protein